MSGKVRVDVALTKEAREILKDEPIRLSLRDGCYFNCNAINQDGAFLDMTVEVESDGRIREFKISIPVRFVLYILSAETARTLGFKGHDREV